MLATLSSYYAARHVPVNTGGPASLLGSDGGDANALYSAPKRLIGPKFCGKHADASAYRSIFQMKRWSQHCAPGEKEKINRVQRHTHLGVAQPCEALAIAVICCGFCAMAQRLRQRGNLSRRASLCICVFCLAFSLTCARV